MATATVERVTYREGSKYPQRGIASADEGGPASYEPLLTSDTAPPPRPG